MHKISALALLANIVLAGVSAAQESRVLREGGFIVRLWEDGSGWVSRTEDFTPPGWSINCKVDAMTDKRMCSFNSSIGGIFVSYGGTSAPKAVCAFGHDFPGRSAMMRVDKLPPVETDLSGCTDAEPLLEQLMAGSSITVRRYEWPRDWPRDETSTLDGFQMTMKIIDRTFFGSEGLQAAREEPPSIVIQLMLNSANELNRRCRGTEGADPASTVCEERDAIGRSLNKLGWCYGKNNEAGYQNTWHRCTPTSWGYQP